MGRKKEDIYKDKVSDRIFNVMMEAKAKDEGEEFLKGVSLFIGEGIRRRFPETNDRQKFESYAQTIDAIRDIVLNACFVLDLAETEGEADK